MPTLTKETSNTTLNQLLDLYPRFLDTRPDSVHHRYHQVLGSALQELRRNIKLVKLSNNLNRPLEIWKEQKEPYKYDICYSVELEGIQQVRLYQENRIKPLKDSGVLKTDTNNYKDVYTTSTEEIIPSIRYYLEVETYDGLIFQKGFPENSTLLGDIYDHDKALDQIGKLNGLKRHQYQKISPEQYNNTYPPYNNSKDEWDACYQKRIQKYLTQYHKKPFPILEFETRYITKPFIVNAADNLAHIDQTTIGAPDQYIATKLFNPNLYHLTFNPQLVPSNIPLPCLEEIKILAKKTFPLSSQVKITQNKTETYELNKEELMPNILEYTLDDVSMTPSVYEEIHPAYIDKSLIDAPNSQITSTEMVEELIQCEKMQNITIPQIITEIQKTLPETTIPTTTPPTNTTKNKAIYTIDFTNKGEHKGTQIENGYLIPNNKIYESIKNAEQIYQEPCDLSYSAYNYMSEWENLTSMYQDGTSWTFGYENQTAWLYGYEFNHQIPLEAQIEEIIMSLEQKPTSNYNYTYKLKIPNPCPQQMSETHLQKGTVQKNNANENFSKTGTTWTLPNIQPVQINHSDFKAGFQIQKGSEKYSTVNCRNLTTIIKWTWKLKNYQITLPLPENNKYETLNIQTQIPSGNIANYTIIYSEGKKGGILSDGENSIHLPDLKENLTLLLNFEGKTNTAQIEKIEYTTIKE